MTHDMGKGAANVTDIQQDCTVALRDVEQGFALIERAPDDDRVLLPLVATKEAIARALDACKAQEPERRLKRQKRTIDGLIEHMEEALVPMPPLPVPAKPRRRPDNAALS